MTDSTIKHTNRIERQFHSKLIQPLNPEIGFNVNSIQRRIQPLNPEIGFNVYYRQRQS